MIAGKLCVQATARKREELRTPEHQAFSFFQIQKVMHSFVAHLIPKRSFGLIVRFLELAAARMGLRGTLCALVLVSMSCWCSASRIKANQTATLLVDASPGMGRTIPQNMFGIFFEEINHAGAGGLWAELISNRGFEDGGPNTPSNIYPWTIIGNETNIVVSTDRTSCFIRNKNIQQGKTYKIALHVRTSESMNLYLSLTSSDGSLNLATATIE
ncbi:hypothetical protein BHM03_00039436 [Ensete ventricosum]|nr:hypothetical protein BHM03_00039436 [Ensete ventricosum]